MVVAAIVLLGLIIGSFLSVCVYRIPYVRGEELADVVYEEEPGLEGLPDLPRAYDVDGGKLSFLHPRRSICPQCKHQLLWWHNLPVLSWLLLRGKCHFCKASIPIRYPMLELITALCAYGSYAVFGFTAGALVVFALCAALIVISFIDIDYYIIPDLISIPGTVLGVVAVILHSYFPFLPYQFAQTLLDSLLGILAGGGFLWCMSVGYLRLRGKVGMGLGDVKLLMLVGAWLGVPGAFFTIFLGSIAGSVLGILLIVLFGRQASQHIPFGPYLAVGTLLYLFLIDPYADVLSVMRTAFLGAQAILV